MQKEKKKRIDGDEMKRIRYIEVRIKLLLLSHFRERFKIKLIWAHEAQTLHDMIVPYVFICICVSIKHKRGSLVSRSKVGSSR